MTYYNSPDGPLDPETDLDLTSEHLSTLDGVELKSTLKVHTVSTGAFASYKNKKYIIAKYSNKVRSFIALRNEQRFLRIPCAQNERVYVVFCNASRQTSF